MPVYSCTLFVVALIIGFILGRWRVPNYCGDVIVSSDSCTFALDIPEDEIPLYQELVFRVVEKENSTN